MAANIKIFIAVSISILKEFLDNIITTKRKLSASNILITIIISGEISFNNCLVEIKESPQKKTGISGRKNLTILFFIT